MYIYLSLLVGLAGALIYVMSSRPKGQELGRLAFLCGLLAFLLNLPPHLQRLMP